MTGMTRMKYPAKGLGKIIARIQNTRVSDFDASFCAYRSPKRGIRGTQIDGIWNRRCPLFFSSHSNAHARAPSGLSYKRIRTYLTIRLALSTCVSWVSQPQWGRQKPGCGCSYTKLPRTQTLVGRPRQHLTS